MTKESQDGAVLENEKSLSSTLKDLNNKLSTRRYKRAIYSRKDIRMCKRKMITHHQMIRLINSYSTSSKQVKLWCWEGLLTHQIANRPSIWPKLTKIRSQTRKSVGVWIWLKRNFRNQLCPQREASNPCKASWVKKSAPNKKLRRLKEMRAWQQEIAKKPWDQSRVSRGRSIRSLDAKRTRYRNTTKASFFHKLKWVE